MNPAWVHTAGDTLDMQVTCEYPSTDGWTLTYYLVPRFTTPTQTPITIACVGNSDGTYQLQAAPSTTAAWKPGAYGWHRKVAKVGNTAVQTLTGAHDQGELLVRANPADLAQGADSRSHARKTLDAIEAVLEGRASKDQEEYTIGNRSLKRTPITDLLVLRDRYRREVAAEDAAAEMTQGARNPRLVGVRFNRA